MPYLFDLTDILEEELSDADDPQEKLKIVNEFLEALDTAEDAALEWKKQIEEEIK